MPSEAPALVAPDSFKGTIPAADAAAAIAAGLRAGGREAIELPLGDGGEGTMDALLAARGGSLREAEVSDPLGRPVTARYAVLDDGTAVVEAAQASGLALLAESELDPWNTSSRGTGELIAATGAQDVLVAVGGTATMDGGAGAVEALQEAGFDGSITAICDVRTPWEDAPRVFGPQKGADPACVKRLEHRFATLAQKAPRDPRGEPNTGCAGGLSGGLWAWLGVRLVPGAAFVLDEVGFDGRMRAARFVVTGEGRLDEQTLAGKLVGEVATRCRQAGVGCHAVVGRDALDPFLVRLLDLASVREAGDVRALRQAGRELAG
ncbi:MAG: glycerate kinase [Thermoleophilaceae bacterium]